MKMIITFKLKKNQNQPSIYEKHLKPNLENFVQSFENDLTQICANSAIMFVKYFNAFLSAPSFL